MTNYRLDSSRSPGKSHGRNVAWLGLGFIFALAQGTVPAAYAGSVVAWGSDSDLQIQAPPGLANVRAVAGGRFHSLALKADGTVTAWGFNLLGQTDVPAGLTNVVAIAARFSESLALRSDGTVAAWGQSSMPEGLSHVNAIAAGWNHSLALRGDGTLVAWGAQTNVPEVAGVLAIAAGHGHNLALRGDGTVFAWGDNAFGKATVPAGLTNVVAIAAGKDHSLALRADGSVVVWGDNSRRQASVPPGLADVVAITAGAQHSLALQADGSVVAWGDNSFNQSEPAGGGNFFAIAGGGYHNLAVRGDGAPIILLQPASQTVAETAVFRVSAVGLQPLRFQWRRDGMAISGATDSVLVVNGVQESDAGAYSVRVSNTAGSVVSAEAILSLAGIAPVILVQPQDQTVHCGESASLQVTATGAEPLRYEWWLGEELLSTESSLLLSEVTGIEAGEYFVVIANEYGAVTSELATLSVTVDPPQITSPLAVSANQGEPFSYAIETVPVAASVIAGALPPGLDFQWADGSGIIFGMPTESGTFDVGIEIANACGSLSETLVISISSSVPVITSPLTVHGTEGMPLIYQIIATGSPMTYAAGELPPGFEFDPVLGRISGVPVYAGQFTSAISASNQWGTTTGTIEFIFVTVPITGLSIANVTHDYSSPYLLDFVFSLRANTNLSLVNFDVRLISVAEENPMPEQGRRLLVIAREEDEEGNEELRFRVFDAVGEIVAEMAAAEFPGQAEGLADLVADLWEEEDLAPADRSAIIDAVSNILGLVDSDTAFLMDARALSVTAFEDGMPISPTETGLFLAQGSTKQFKTHLVLDFTMSIATLAHGDSNNNGISDAIEEMVLGAQNFVDQQRLGSQVGVFQFHREDRLPQQVVPLTTDRDLLKGSIAGIWDNYVGGFPAGSRCWDALWLAIMNLGEPDRDEQHYVVFVSDGRDESSLATVADVIDAATERGVKIYCIGFGNELAPVALQAITAATEGRYYDAREVGGLTAAFNLIGKDLNAQYVLRWATLRRAGDFVPSFRISYQNLTAFSPPPVIEEPDDPDDEPVIIHIIPPYTPAVYAGDPTDGSLRLVADEEDRAGSIILRAAYLPRYVRRILIHYHPNWPVTVRLLSTGPGELLHGWSLTEEADGEGGRWLELVGPDPGNLESSLPFVAMGNLVQFSFTDMEAPSGAFSHFEIINAIYETTGGQSFVLENKDDFVPGPPVITSPLMVDANERESFMYQITATHAPFIFSVSNLPLGLSVEPWTGLIWGTPVYSGTFSVTIHAGNGLGTGTDNLLLTVAPAPIEGLSMTDVTYRYSAPYLLDFEFSLRGNDDPARGDAIVVDPGFLAVVCREDGQPISTTQTSFFLTQSIRPIQAHLVLDFSESTASRSAVDDMVRAAQHFVNHQSPETQIGVYEYHRDDQGPEQVAVLTTDKELLTAAIASIWLERVRGFPAGSRCWDALLDAIEDLGEGGEGERRAVVFVSNGRADASVATVEDVIEAAVANGVRMYGIGFGDNLDDETLQSITSATGGLYYGVGGPAALALAFNLISKDLNGRYVLRWHTLRRTGEFEPSFEITYASIDEDGEPVFLTAASPPSREVAVDEEYASELLTFGEVSALPAEGTRLIVVARIGNEGLLHFRVFDDLGEMVVDAAEAELTGQAEQVQALKADEFWGGDLEPEQMESIRDSVLSIFEPIMVYVIPPYSPEEYAGPVTAGSLHLTAGAEVNSNSVILRASYVPRHIRRLRIHYRANWPVTPTLESTGLGELLGGWRLFETDDGEGGAWLEIVSPDPPDLGTSIPFTAFGNLIRFSFRDMTEAATAFSFFEVDNTIYANTGGQRFVTENRDSFITVYPALPHGTPVPWLIAHGFTDDFEAAELSDPDGDGIPTWKEYRANTDPRDPDSGFFLRRVALDALGGREITFATARNRTYRVDHSTDLENWQILLDDIAGTGADAIVSDLRILNVPRVFYRVAVY